jgi:hypothetical protein
LLPAGDAAAGLLGGVRHRGVEQKRGMLFASEASVFCPGNDGYVARRRIQKTATKNDATRKEKERAQYMRLCAFRQRSDVLLLRVRPSAVIACEIAPARRAPACEIARSNRHARARDSCPMHARAKRPCTRVFMHANWFFRAPVLARACRYCMRDRARAPRPCMRDRAL